MSAPTQHPATVTARRRSVATVAQSRDRSTHTECAGTNPFPPAFPPGRADGTVHIMASSGHPIATVFHPGATPDTLAPAAPAPLGELGLQEGVPSPVERTHRDAATWPAMRATPTAKGPCTCKA